MAHEFVILNTSGVTTTYTSYEAIPVDSTLKNVIKFDEDIKNNAALSVTSRYLSLFPNFIIGTYFPNQIGVYLNVPLSPNITTQKRIISFSSYQEFCFFHENMNNIKIRINIQTFSVLP